nr:hypothetical protein RSP597_09800 [Ralstonia solanacearum]
MDDWGRFEVGRAKPLLAGVGRSPLCQSSASDRSGTLGAVAIICVLTEAAFAALFVQPFL